MVLRTIVVIGSRKYRNKEMMENILNRRVLIFRSTKNTLIISGKCPMEDSIDNWAVAWAKENFYYDIEIPPKINDKSGYFRRNKIMAHYADEIIAFIPRNQYRSGTWNCISEFRKMGKTDYKVVDEEGKEGDRQWK